MNSQNLPAAIRSLLEALVGVESQHAHFVIIGGVGLFVILFIGRILAASVGGSKKNFLVCFIGLLIPVLGGLLAFGFAFPWLALKMPQGAQALALASAAGTGVVLLVLLIAGRTILGVSIMSGLWVGLITYALAWGAMVTTRYGLQIYEANRERIEEYQEELDPKIKWQREQEEKRKQEEAGRGLQDIP